VFGVGIICLLKLGQHLTFIWKQIRGHLCEQFS